jgi:hypothetical protein
MMEVGEEEKTEEVELREGGERDGVREGAREW